MRCKKIMKTLFVVLCLLGIFTCTKIEAKQTCTTQEKNTLIQLAHNVKIDYELSDYKKNGKRQFAVTISNLVDGMYVLYDSYIYRYDKYNLGIAKVDNYFNSANTYIIGIYADYHSACPGEFLLNKTITIPKYNQYSERNECKGIESFKLCQRWYAESFTEAEFKKQIEEYKNSLNSKVETHKKEQKQSIIEQFIKLYMNNIYISAGLTIVAGVIFVIIIIKIAKRKNKIKIKI